MRARTAVASLLLTAAAATFAGAGEARGAAAALMLQDRPGGGAPAGKLPQDTSGGGARTLGLAQDSTCHSRVTWRYLPPQPSFTPFTHPPELLDHAAARTAVLAQYPPELRRAGTSGVTGVWAFVDECGRVRVTRVRASSGTPALDSAAVRAVATFRFSPAWQGRFPTPVWIQLPVVFGNVRVPPMARGPRADTLRVPPPVRTDALLRFPAPPGFTGPTLRNESEIAGRLWDGYAPYQAEGVRGTTTLALRLDPAGRVTTAAIARSSGYTELDELALAIGRAMAFFPAVDDHGRYSSVTTTVPIRFGP